MVPANTEGAEDASEQFMDDSLRRVCALLRAEDNEVRTAAARVLGALHPDEPEVVRALGEALGAGDRRFKREALEAIATIGSTDVYDQVVPLLDEEGDLGRRAMEVVAAMGKTVLRPLKRRFETAGEAERRRILAIAARLRGAQGLDLIVRALEKGHAQHVRDAGRRLAEEIDTAPPRDRTAFISRLEKFVEAGAHDGQTEAIEAALDLLGRLGGADSAALLLGISRSHGDDSVRRNAVHALARMARRTPLDARQLAELLESLADPAYAALAGPALPMLGEGAGFDEAHAPALVLFLKGTDPSLRRFAVAALGSIDTTASASALLQILRVENPDLQERARKALTRLKSAIDPAAAALAAVPNPAVAWSLARMIQPNAFRLSADQVRTIARAAAGFLEPGDPRAEALVFVLKDRHAEVFQEECVRRAKLLKRKRAASEIANLLRPLVREGIPLGTVAQYELALAEIVRGKKDVVREVRLRNPGLQALEPLLRDPELALPTKLKRDKSFLGAEEYYLIGCHFAERPGTDRIFGGDLLRWLVKVFPDERISQAASHKLVMEGFPPPPRERPRPSVRPKPKPASAAPKAPSKKKEASARVADKKPTRKAARAKKAATKIAKKPAKAAKKTPARKAAQKKAPKKAGARAGPKKKPSKKSPRRKAR